MADPVSWVALGSTALGAGVSAVGASAKAESEAGIYTYQAGVASINQRIQKQNADYARKTGEVEAQQSGMKTGAAVGQTKIQQAASGLDVNVGSPVDVRSSEIAIGQEDQAIIRSNAARRAYGFDVEAMNAGERAKVYGAAADNAKTAGKLGVISSILGGASSVSSKWLQGKSVGLYGSDDDSGYYGGSPESNRNLRPA